MTVRVIPGGFPPAIVIAPTVHTEEFTRIRRAIDDLTGRLLNSDLADHVARTMGDLYRLAERQHAALEEIHKAAADSGEDLDGFWVARRAEEALR